VDDQIGEFGFRSEDVKERSADALLADAPVEKHEKEDGGVGGGNVDVGVGAAKKRVRNFKIPDVGSMAVTNGAHAGEQSEEIFSQDEDEETAEVPETPFHGHP